MIRSNALEDVVLRAPVKEIRIRKGAHRHGPTRTLCHLRKEHQAVGLGKWQRAQQDGVHDAENSGIRADSQGQSDDCNNGECRRLAQHAYSVANVLEKGVHYGFSFWFLYVQRHLLCRTETLTK